MAWGCVSRDCKLDLITVQGNFNGPRYQKDILEIVVVPHFDIHALATRSVFIEDNARSHRARAVIDFLQPTAITTIPWWARSSNQNPIQHLLNIVGRRVRQGHPPVQFPLLLSE